MQTPLDEDQRPSREFGNRFVIRSAFPASFTQLLWFSRVIEASLQPRGSCLLWVTGFGIFQSSENHHLYYRLRQSYGEPRLLHEAPGHLCLDYERPEVVTLTYLAILFGWDIHIIPTGGYGRALICHDEWAMLGFDDENAYRGTHRELVEAKIEVSTHGAV
jgi:hypothetical protein